MQLRAKPLMISGRLAILALNLAFAAAAAPAAAPDAGPSEYQVKAAYLFNFAKFVEWPPQALAAPSAPFVIGVLGENPFGHDLEGMLQNKSINTHPVTVRYFKSLADLKACQILFISVSENKRWREIFDALGGAGVLTVTENSDSFLASGGMLNLFSEQDKVRFEINDDAARRAGLRISSKLLLLAGKKSSTHT
jgi:hypothetical protein